MHYFWNSVKLATKCEQEKYYNVKLIFAFQEFGVFLATPGYDVNLRRQKEDGFWIEKMKKVTGDDGKTWLIGMKKKHILRNITHN